MAKIQFDQQKFQVSTHIDAWEQLKQFTDARIALGRTGCSLPTKPMLDFQLSHAQARDAVFQVLDTEQLSALFIEQNITTLTVQSQAENKEIFLKRPDLGRLLNQDSRKKIQDYQNQHPENYDVGIVIGDGLSARAIEENAYAMTMALKALFDQEHWRLAPIVIATGSRVALGDQIAELMNIPMLIMMIGERPGLSSPDSMGIYYTWQAKTGSLDAERNCISNIRAAGLTVPIASQRLLALMRNSKKDQISGVHLKDQHEVVEIQQKSQKSLF